MASKQKTVYICSNCGYESAKWYGKCPSCNEWGTLNEEIIRLIDNFDFVDRVPKIVIYLNNEDDTCCFPLEYDNSLYRTFETRKNIKERWIGNERYFGARSKTWGFSYFYLFTEKH